MVKKERYTLYLEKLFDFGRGKATLKQVEQLDPDQGSGRGMAKLAVRIRRRKDPQGFKSRLRAPNE